MKLNNPAFEITSARVFLVDSFGNKIGNGTFLSYCHCCNFNEPLNVSNSLKSLFANTDEISLILSLLKLQKIKASFLLFPYIP